jgi:Sec-independent protein translocase protein TatA
MDVITLFSISTTSLGVVLLVLMLIVTSSKHPKKTRKKVRSDIQKIKDQINGSGAEEDLY